MIQYLARRELEQRGASDTPAAARWRWFRSNLGRITFDAQKHAAGHYYLAGVTVTPRIGSYDPESIDLAFDAARQANP